MSPYHDPMSASFNGKLMKEKESQAWFMDVLSHTFLRNS